MPDGSGGEPRDLIERVADELRRPVPPDPALRRRIEAAIHGLPRGRRPRRAPPRLGRRLQVAFALAALILLSVALFAWSRREPEARTVQFVLAAPSAGQVTLVGDFNDWSPTATPLQRSVAGVWVVTMRLEPGQYQYGFLVDGSRWMLDPRAPSAGFDDVGPPNSLVMVL